MDQKRIARLHDRLPEWCLRAGLAITYFYSGYHMVLDPASAVGFVPVWFSRAVSVFMPIESYLWLQGAGELVVALVLVLWITPRAAVTIIAALMVLQLSLILLFTGLDVVTFRDAGLIGAALALFFVSRSHS